MVKTICVSGGFDPLHTGHLDMFREAATHGRLTVIINSDAWLLRKKGFVFQPWQQRAAIIGELRCVAEVAHVDDADNTVCEALARLKPDFFANGGDRKLRLFRDECLMQARNEIARQERAICRGAQHQ